MTQGDRSLLETLEKERGSASASSKFVDGRIKGTFVSDYIFNLSQKGLLPSEIKVLEKGLGFFPTPSSINEVVHAKTYPILAGKCNVNGFSERKGRKLLVKYPSLRVSPLRISQKERLYSNSF